MGTAAGLRSLNEVGGFEYYRVPEDAEKDQSAAEEIFRGKPAIDVQTHFQAPHSFKLWPRQYTESFYRETQPDWWIELDTIGEYDLAAYIRKIFIETENAVAVLTSGPGVDESRHVFNDEMAATRKLFNTMAGTGRLYNHSLVHAYQANEMASMEDWAKTYSPVGWKVYTFGELQDGVWKYPWNLTDENVGIPFLEKARSTGVKLVCAHKGLSGMVNNGSPADIGPSAVAYPDLNFVIYHSGYELPTDAPPEGPYDPDNPGPGIDRLLDTMRVSGLGLGSNVYAELGTTWFNLIRNPEQAAHSIGKLLKYMGEDNVIWGTDSIWYGGAQPLLDAFRVFQIPERLSEQYGYPQLTPEIKAKVLYGNAARVYGIDYEAACVAYENDDLAWARKILADYEAGDLNILR
ncbi:hypothetical protein A5695_25635 [Mycobacterium sp. E1747]|nr:hypothetical protein A5695_25635 [Mycobacterium sp. E1747]